MMALKSQTDNKWLKLLALEETLFLTTDETT